MDIKSTGKHWRELSSFIESEGIVFRQVGPALAVGARSSEVDIVALVDDWRKIPQTIERYCRTNGSRLLSVRQPSQRTIQLLLGGFSEAGALECLQVRATNELYVGSRRCMDAPTLLAGSDAPGVIFTHHLLQSAATATMLPGRFELLADLLRQDREQVLQWCGQFWSTSEISNIEGSLQSSNVASLSAMLPQLRRSARLSGERTLTTVLQEARLALRRIRHPSGIFLAVLGPDGSGKTSVINGLTSELEGTMSGRCHIHFRPKFGAPQTTNLISRHPHSRAPRGLIGSLFKAVFYAYDEIVSYVGLIRPRLVRNELVIFDRYFTDLLIDPVRYRYGGPARVVELLDRLVPRPDLMLVMDAPAEVIQKRIQEVSEDETFRQCTAYRDLAKRYSSVRLIDASREQLHVSQQARAVVVDHLEQTAASDLCRFQSNRTGRFRTDTQTEAAALV